MLGQLAGAFSWLLGGSLFGGGGRSRRSDRKNSVLGGKVPGWLVLAVAFACFGGGYFVGGRFGGRDPGDAGLRASLDGAGADKAGPERAGPQKPGIIEDTKKLSNNAFFVSAYNGLPDDEARERASLLAGWLAEHGLDKARPYQMEAVAGLTWFVVVYFSGDGDREATKAKLRALPEGVPDAEFQRFKNVETDWPPAFPIR